MRRKKLISTLILLFMILLMTPMHTYARPSKNTKSQTLKQSRIDLSNATSGIEISWTKVPNAKSYQIYKKNDQGKFIPLKSVKSSAKRRVLDKKVKSGKKYTYRVKALNGSRSSMSKAKSLMRLTSPTISLNKQKKQVKIAWNKTTPAKSYVIYKKTGKGAYKKIKTIKVTSQKKKSYSFYDENVTCQKTYTYAVQVKVDGSSSAYKNKAKSLIYKKHTYGAPRWVNATCKSKGYNIKFCVRCSHPKRYDQTKTVSSHIWENQSHNGGWVQVGDNEMERTCTACGQVAKRPISTGSVILDYGVQFVGGKFHLNRDNLTLTSDCSIDCSHFIYRVLKNSGVYDTGYHYSRQWKNYGQKVTPANAQPGDVIVLDGHCAFYMGGGSVLHASRQLAYPDGGIRITDFGNTIYDALKYFKNERGQKLLGIRRFTKE